VQPSLLVSFLAMPQPITPQRASQAWTNVSGLVIRYTPHVASKKRSVLPRLRHGATACPPPASSGEARISSRPE